MKKLLVLGIIPEVPENHPNMETLLGELSMEAVEFSVSADVKMCKYRKRILSTKIEYLILVNCLVGKSSGQPKFGCPFCDSGVPYKLEEYELYTLGDLEDWHEVGYKYMGWGWLKNKLLC